MPGAASRTGTGTDGTGPRMYRGRIRQETLNG